MSFSSKLIMACICAIVSIYPSRVVHAQHTSSYHIGNSLTNDSSPWLLRNFSYQDGRSHDVAYHIRCGSSLPTIWSDLTTCVPSVEPYGTYDTALPEYEWDFVTFQPFSGSTLAQDRQVINDFIDLAQSTGLNNTTRFLIYQAWPQTGDVTGGVPQDYSSKWNGGVVDDPLQPTVFSREYFDFLIDDVRNDRPNARVDMIPVGEVFAELDRQIKSGELVIDGYASVNDFYRDPQHLHMNNLGKWVAANTVYSVLFSEDPSFLIKPDTVFIEDDRPEIGVYLDSDLLTPQVQSDLQQIVWGVVSSHNYTGIPEPSCFAILSILGSLSFTRRRR